MNRIYGFLFAAFVSCANADVVDDVELFMAEHRIDFGLNPDAETCVFIGTDVRVVHTPVSSPNFFVSRNAAIKAAERNARAEIMRLVSSRITGARKTHLETDGVAQTENTSSLVEVFSQEPLYGCEPICVREEKDGNAIRVAVAMKWSAAAEAEALAAKRGDVDFEAISDTNEWIAWASSFDFAHAGTSTSFTGSDGIRRYVGIGYADIEGKTGGLAVSAKRAARQSAGAELAYSLFGEAEAQSIAKRLKEASSDGTGASQALTAQAFEDQVSLAVSGRVVRDSEVYTTTIIHPLTGRKLFVSVAGIEPQDLAEMNLLGDSHPPSSRKGSSSARPDHPTRPNHSVRPEHPNRPEHPVSRPRGERRK